MKIPKIERKYRRRRAGGAFILACLALGSPLAGSCFYGAPLQSEDVQTGDRVTFGTYEQIDGQYGDEDLEWLVLDKDEEGGRALLVTSDCIECMPFHSEKTDITWEDCSLRQWLNSVFLQEAFSKEEQDQILETDVETRTLEDSGEEEIVTSKDRVFLLSDEQARRYFEKKSDRTAGVSQAIREKLEEDADEESGLKPGVSELSDAAFWWLRTPGDRGDCVQCVGAEGSLVTAGYLAVQANFGVRPALWVDLD